MESEKRMKHTYDDGDHTKREMRELEKFVERFADRHPDYYRHIQKVVSEIKPSSKLEALQFEYDAMAEYDQKMKEI
jgi:hypothetical protein